MVDPVCVSQKMGGMPGHPVVLQIETTYEKSSLMMTMMTISCQCPLRAGIRHRRILMITNAKIYLNHSHLLPFSHHSTHHNHLTTVFFSLSSLSMLTQYADMPLQLCPILFMSFIYAITMLKYVSEYKTILYFTTEPALVHVLVNVPLGFQFILSSIFLDNYIFLCVYSYS